MFQPGKVAEIGPVKPKSERQGQAWNHSESALQPPSSGQSPLLGLTQNISRPFHQWEARLKAVVIDSDLLGELSSWIGLQLHFNSLIFTGLPPSSALRSAAKMTSKLLSDSVRLVSSMSLPASSASKNAWNCD